MLLLPAETLMRLSAVLAVSHIGLRIRKPCVNSVGAGVLALRYKVFRQSCTLHA